MLSPESQLTFIVSSLIFFFSLGEQGLIFDLSLSLSLSFLDPLLSLWVPFSLKGYNVKVFKQVDVRFSDLPLGELFAHGSNLLSLQHLTKSHLTRIAFKKKLNS